MRDQSYPAGIAFIGLVVQPWSMDMEGKRRGGGWGRGIRRVHTRGLSMLPMRHADSTRTLCFRESRDESSISQ